MTEQRLPKPGEVWMTTGRTKREIVNAYPDAVTYRYPDEGSAAGLWAMTLDDFLEHTQPPEPTVVQSRHIFYKNRVMWTDEASRDRPPSYDAEPVARLDLMSDGEFRVVKL